MQNIFVRFFYSVFPPRSDKKNIEKVVDRIVSDHAASLKKLDLYDRGEIQKTRDMVNHPSVRDYLRTIQKTST